MKKYLFLLLVTILLPLPFQSMAMVYPERSEKLILQQKTAEVLASGTVEARKTLLEDVYKEYRQKMIELNMAQITHRPYEVMSQLSADKSLLENLIWQLEHSK